MFPILSRNQIKFIRSLKQKKYRYKFKKYVVEGIKLITDLMEFAPDSIHYIVLQKDITINELKDDFDIYLTDDATFKSLSTMTSPQGIMAVCNIPDLYFDREWKTDGFALFFDAVQDPGNLGTMLRAAEWFGVKSIITGPGTVDPYNSKVVQAAMGSQSYVDIYSCDYEQLVKSDCPILIADMEGENAFETVWPENGVLVLGNEGKGISNDLLALNTKKIKLPSAPGARTESLNVSMACTALLTLRWDLHNG